MPEIGAQASGGRRRAAADLARGLVPLAVLAGATWWLLGLPASYLVQVLALYGLFCLFILWGAPQSFTGSGIGAANRITLGRATLVLPVAGLAFQPQLGMEAAYWWVIVWATVAMLLDSLDGRVARRTETTSSFGARFDMELDAFLLLVLSVLVWQSQKAGAWVLLIGALRYLFIAAGWIWSALKAELPKSGRRQTICVVQGGGLLVCLGPIIPGKMAAMVAAGSLGLLVYSFGADVRWLISQE